MKPCPFCGGEELEVDNLWESAFFVSCKTCGGASGIEPSEDEAIENWNRRYDVTPH